MRGSRREAWYSIVEADVSSGKPEAARDLKVGQVLSTRMTASTKLYSKDRWKTLWLL